MWVLTAMVATSCAKAQAKSAPDGPPLDMPQPPPRVVVVAPEEPIPPAPADETPAAAPAPPRPVPQPARVTPRPEPKAEAPAAAAAEGKPQEPRTLRAPGDSPSERAIRDRLNGASRDIGRVNPSRLTAGGRSQYEQARRFIQQAEQALREQDLVFAATLADKAATLAAELLR